MSATTCPECGVRFARTHHAQIFCSPAHKLVHHNRTAARGKTIATLVQAWRLGRNTKDPMRLGAAGDAFNEFCRLADRWSAEDAEAGRLDAIGLVLRQAAGGHRPPIQPKVKKAKGPMARPAAAVPPLQSAK